MLETIEKQYSEKFDRQKKLGGIIEGLKSKETSFEISKYSFDFNGKKFSLPKITFKTPLENQSGYESLSARITAIGTTVLENPYDLNLLEQEQLVSFINQSPLIQQIKSSSETQRALRRIEKFGQKASELAMDNNAAIVDNQIEINRLQNTGNALQGQLEKLENDSEQAKEIRTSQRQLLTKIQHCKKEIAYLVSLGVDQITIHNPESVILPESNSEIPTATELAKTIQEEPKEYGTFLSEPEKSISEEIPTEVADNLKQKLSEKIYPIEQKSKRQSAVDKLKNISKIVAGNWKRIGLATTLAGILQFSSDQILEQRNTIAIQEKNQTEVVNKPKNEEELNSLRPKVIENIVEFVTKRPLQTKIIELNNITNSIELLAEQSFEGGDGSQINLDQIISLIRNKVDTNLGNELANMPRVDLQKIVTVQNQLWQNGFTKTALKITIKTNATPK